MKIVSYNVNGIRAALRKGLTDWIEGNSFDIICFQELKANVEDIPSAEFEKFGYKTYWFSAEKKGYSGVGIISKIEPKTITYGIGHDLFDYEGRSIKLEFENFVLINTYFPSGTSGNERQEIKYEFLDFYFNYIQDLKKEHENIIVVGDYNIAHTEIDIHNPVSNKKSSGFLPEERAWMTKWFENEMIDTFRLINGDVKDSYSWWSYRANSRNNNKGWRIDYISASKSLAKLIMDAHIHSDAIHSDHCPISADFEL